MSARARLIPVVKCRTREMGTHAKDTWKHGPFWSTSSKETGREARTESRLSGLYPNTGQMQQAGLDRSQWVPWAPGHREGKIYRAPEISLLNRKRVTRGNRVTEEAAGITVITSWLSAKAHMGHDKVGGEHQPVIRARQGHWANMCWTQHSRFTTEKVFERWFLIKPKLLLSIVSEDLGGAAMIFKVTA